MSGRPPEVPPSDAGLFAPPPTRSGLVNLIGGDLFGLEGRPIDVQVDVAERQSPSVKIIGLAGQSTRESLDRIERAIVHTGFRAPRARILINLAPATRRKQGVGLDLPIALGILLASGQLRLPGGRELASRSREVGLVGELDLSGELRPVRGVLLVVDRLRALGIDQFVVPEPNVQEVSWIRGISVWPAADLRQAGEVFCRPKSHEPARAAPPPPRSGDGGGDFVDVRGQEATKRGLLIAAAGGHNLLLHGPPGVGKTMLARRIPGILPPLSHEEAVEVLRVESVLTEEPSSGLPSARPFRAPHHTASFAGLVGGGNPPSPGEVTRAHQGVLFLDEFPEFARGVLDALREPLESDEITLGRSGCSLTYPARFLLVAAMNPCPCGYLGHPRRACSCSPRSIETYRRRISGPLLDRIDVVLRVNALGAGELTQLDGPVGVGSAVLRRQVEEVRARQLARWGAGRSNARVGLDELLPERITEPAALDCLRERAVRLDLSTRGFTRTLRVARSIADLAGSERVGKAQILEALQYRGESSS